MFLSSAFSEVSESVDSSLASTAFFRKVFCCPSWSSLTQTSTTIHTCIRESDVNRKMQSRITNTTYTLSDGTCCFTHKNTQSHRFVCIDVFLTSEGGVLTDDMKLVSTSFLVLNGLKYGLPKTREQINRDVCITSKMIGDSYCPFFEVLRSAAQVLEKPSASQQILPQSCADQDNNCNGWWP